MGIFGGKVSERINGSIFGKVPDRTTETIHQDLLATKKLLEESPKIRGGRISGELLRKQIL